ncbi:glycosyltransferase family 4 protein [Spongiimicrobium salis]|uniref:glycosyltransferase family 4 protein n=1 Tax=Spongiimicrobium salis TaxID=1667022 RepID=UPI00374DDF19
MKKVLVITYYWPPAGGPGVQRWLKFVKYLRDFDIEPVVYVPENPNYPIVDESFMHDIPSGVQVHKLKIKEPYRLANIFSKKAKRISSGIITQKNQSFAEKLLLWIRGNFFIPDARKFWIKPSVRFLSKLIQEEQITTMITTGPPHSVHLIGNRIKEQLGIHWVADFRDPWTSIGYHKQLKLTASSRKKHKELEKRVLQNADQIVVTSRTTKREFEAIAKTPITCITNGYDTRDITEASTLDEKFTISHIGSMLTGRNPENLWKVLSELIKSNAAFKYAVQLQFIGVISTDVLETVHQYGLEPYVRVLGYVSHEEAIRYQRSSQVLLLTEINAEETRGIIPGKLFEYMSAGRPIFGIGPKDWDVAALVAETKTGAIFDYDSYSELKNVLLNWFAQYKVNQLSVSSANVEQYSRKKLTEKLSKILQWE